MKCKFKIIGLDCANCALELERLIKKIDGVKEANINFISQKMEIELEENKKDDVIKNVKKVIKKEEPDVSLEEI